MEIVDVKIQVIKRDIPVPSEIDLRHEGIITDEDIEGNGFISLTASGVATGQYLSS